LRKAVTSTPLGMLAAYDRLIDSAVLSLDSAQREAAVALDNLSVQLQLREQQKGGFGGFLRRKNAMQKGLYIWGDVGRGKTLLMDMFFERVNIANKRRVHFHEFMDELHQNIALIRQNYSESYSANSSKITDDFDPVALAVKPIIKSTSLLCFDEFHVSDITNAMLLGRLFEKLFAAGMVVVATSNVKPDRLYHNGLNRQLFIPFIELLKGQCNILYLQGAKDYRLDKLISQPVFHFGNKQATSKEMERHWQILTGGQKSAGGQVAVLGRNIIVPQMAMGCARFSFTDLCEQPLGARDYLAISHDFHTLMIENIPRFESAGSNGAKRFITLIDTLYDRGVKLVASFEVELTELSGDKNTAFEFKRTASRLREMASKEYLAKALSD